MAERGEGAAGRSVEAGLEGSEAAQVGLEPGGPRLRRVGPQVARVNARAFESFRAPASDEGVARGVVEGAYAELRSRNVELLGLLPSDNWDGEGPGLRVQMRERAAGAGLVLPLLESVA